MTTNLTIAKLLHDLVSSDQLGNSLGDLLVQGLCLDSRGLNQGDVFLAVAGSTAHGLDFLEKAQEKQPAAIVYEPNAQYSNVKHNEIPIIAVPDLHKHVSLIASRFYDEPSNDLNIIAITGTNGKTTCAYLLTQLLNATGVDAAMIGTIGSGRLNNLQASELTTPDAIKLQACLADFRKDGISHVVMEASSHALHQHRLDAVKVDIAAFTNLTQDHLDYHQDMSDYLQAKARLFSFDSITHAVINADDSDCKRLVASIPDEVKKTTYSVDGQHLDADLVAGDIQVDSSITRFEVKVDGQKTEIETRLIGQFNVSNVLLVVGVMRALGSTLESLVAEIKNLNAPTGRMQRLSKSNAPTVVIDYAHTPDALEKTLSILRSLADEDLAAVFGCGGDRDRGKRAVMGAIAERFADRIYLTDDNPRTENSSQIINDIASGIVAKDKAKIISDRAKAITMSIQDATVKDIVLIAGKGHEDYQIIGAEKFPFSDQQHAQSALDNWQESR
jgi:UDP-N-acetylmuramoyl-L-alanyl-D-glutamate--2,6-diaminopimelate ligase